MTAKFATSMQREVAKYARQNMAKVTLYVRDPYVKRYLTEEKITKVNFVGTIGGLLGLFMGFSFVSGTEVLYYVFVHGVGRLRKRLLKVAEDDSKVGKLLPGVLKADGREHVVQTW
jgi:hypothetical protein